MILEKAHYIGHFIHSHDCLNKKNNALTHTQTAHTHDQTSPVEPEQSKANLIPNENGNSFLLSLFFSFFLSISFRSYL